MAGTQHVHSQPLTIHSFLDSLQPRIKRLGNVEFQVFCDGTFQPIVDTKHRFNGYYSGGDFSMFSPDATKREQFRARGTGHAAPRPLSRSNSLSSTRS